MSTIVVALGGNAILQSGQKGTHAEQRENIRQAAAAIAGLAQAGHRVIVTHGNGPQVGNILVQQEEAAKVVSPMPLDVCGAQTQGMLGYMFQQELTNALRQREINSPVVTIVTQTEVSAEDKAFTNLTKPVGPYYPAEEAAKIQAEKGWQMKEDKARGGWRRLVASPEPIAIVERDSIVKLVEDGAMVISSGGGGVPVVKAADGTLTGVEAVIDKDLAGYRLAVDVKADAFVILTDVTNVAIHWGTPEQKNLGELTLAEMREIQKEGHFAAGSMGPKVEACLRFVEEAGGRAIITALDKVAAAIEGGVGTQIKP